MLKTLKVTTSELVVGMFVSGLDRPWLETPFFTQGFVIESQDDIARLGKYCDYVYIDSLRGVRAGYDLNQDPVKRAAKPAQKPVLPLKKAEHERPRVPISKIFAGRELATYADDSAWEEEHPRAREALNTLVGDIDEIYSQVSAGDKLNVIKLRKSVDPIVDSISRNPDACVWVARLKQHDEYTYQHSLGASIWAVSVGRQLGLARHDLRSLSMGCMLMDVGKLRLAPELLRTDRTLNNEEMAELAGHVGHGLEILEDCGIMNQDVIDIVAHHHERYDGSGYPNSLHNDSIPPFARLAGIVDTYDAITSSRDYAPAIAPAEAIKLLYNSRDKEFQAELVEAFIQAVGIYPAGTLVELTSGEVGVVVAEYRTRRLRPKVMVLLDSRKNRLPRSRIIDLHEESANGSASSLGIKCSLEPEAYDIDLSAIPQ